MPLITPPFRTSLLTANGVPFATDNGDIQTTRDWWMYWNQLTDRSNSNSKLATAGTHADRPMPGSMPEGALYYENDRGVLYANADGHWLYVAGTMWGTAGGPDQRPTDLAAADVGFDFRTNVSPAREFIWSGGRWIEVTPMLYGTHAQRIAATIADLWAGMAWMETDRGNVIYQNQSFLWIYAAGVMVAALASRPTDLGTNDAGFRFESTDTKQNFRWSGSAWVETALVDPTTTKGDLIARGAAAPATRLGVGADGQILTADSTQPLGVKWAGSAGVLLFANPTTNVTLTAAAQDVPGGSLTLTKAGVWLVSAVFYFFQGGSGDAGSFLEGWANLNGTTPAALAVVSTVLSGASTVSQQWRHVAASAGEIVKMQCLKNGGTGTSTLYAFSSSISATWISP